MGFPLRTRRRPIPPKKPVPPPATAGNAESVLVGVRLRPSLSQEKPRSAVTVQGRSIALEGRAPETFDHVFPATANNETVFDELGTRVISAVLRGCNGCIMAYGITGSGKTHSMIGHPQDPGLIPRAIGMLFEALQQRYGHSGPSTSPASTAVTPSSTTTAATATAAGAGAGEACEFLVRASFLEIYRERVQDLLSPASGPSSSSSSAAAVRLATTAKGTRVMGATEVVVSSVEDVLALLAKGQARRREGSTKLNQRSSRSHAVLQLVVEFRSGQGDGGSDSSDSGTMQSTLLMADLAGSERSKRAGTEGVQLKEVSHFTADDTPAP